jgi:hypothetical protein
MSEIKIENNIPCPVGRASGGKWKSILSTMKDGESFVVDNLTVAGSVRASAHQAGFRIKSHCLDDGRVRIWKISTIKP